MTTRKPVHPRCPHCSSGRIKLKSERLDEYYRLFYCLNCGAVHGVVPDLVEEPKSFFEEAFFEVEADTPRCPTHNHPLKLVVVPPGYKEAGKSFLVCPAKGCGYREETGPPSPRSSPTGPPANPVEPDARPQHRLSIFKARQEIIDLVSKAAHRKMTPNRIGAMVHGSGGLYSETIMAPLCAEHKIPMEQITVPTLYKEAGQRLWVCPQYAACEQWEQVRK